MGDKYSKHLNVKCNPYIYNYIIFNFNLIYKKNKGLINIQFKKSAYRLNFYHKLNIKKYMYFDNTHGKMIYRNIFKGEI